MVVKCEISLKNSNAVWTNCVIKDKKDKRCIKFR